MQPQPLSVTEQLIRSIVGFPKYAYEWIVGLIVAILSDLHITTLALTGVAAGFVFDPVVGVLAFFATYAFSRVVGTVANAIGFGLENHTNAINRLADAYYQCNAPAVTIQIPEDPGT